MEFPTIKLEVDRMKYAVIHAFAQHNREIEAAVERELEEVLASFDFEKEVKDAANKAMKQAIQYYFEYGEGKDWMRIAIGKALSETFGGEKQ